MSEPEDVHAAMRVLRQAVPGSKPEINRGTIVLWHRALRGYEPGELVEGSVEWAESRERFPSLGEFLGLLGARRRRPKVVEPVTRQVGPVPLARDRIAEALRVAADTARQLPIRHDHRGGWERCPTCGQPRDRDGLGPAGREVAAAVERVRGAG